MSIDSLIDPTRGIPDSIPAQHALDDAPVCATHRLDVPGTVAEAKFREISPVATCNPPSHGSAGPSYGRCSTKLGWLVPYRDFSIRPHDSLKQQDGKMFRVPRTLIVPSSGTDALPIMRDVPSAVCVRCNENRCGAFVDP